jgi:hypothetical protein
MKKLLLVCLLTIAQSSYSADLTEVNIFGEDITGCNLSSDSVTASLLGTMRYNRINVSKGFNGVNLYHQVTAMRVQGGCVANVRVEFKVYDYIFVKNLNKKVMSNAVICGNVFLLTGPEHNIQTRVNDSAKEIAQKCLLEISKL